jgi:hypothetical protein
MKSINRLVLSALVAVFVSAQVALAADGDTKVVRKIWFPRFSPDGKLLLAAHGGWAKNEGGEVRLYNAMNGEVQHIIPLPRGVRSVAWSAKGTYFVAGGYGFGIRGFDAKDRKALFHLAAERAVENLRITSDDKLLVASFGAGDVRLYNLANRKEVGIFEGVHSGGIWGMALSPNDNLLATGGKDRNAIVFDFTTRKKLHTLTHPGEVNGLAFTKDNSHLVTGCTDSQIRFFDLKSGEQIALLKGHERGTVNDLQFTSDGKLLASSGIDGTIRLWDVTDLKNPSEKKVFRAHSLAFGVAISPDDRWVVSVGWDEQIKMWDLKSGEEVWTRKRE